MSTEDTKVWERPWSVEEIIENADNWSLAGDVALLNSLKSFSDHLLNKTNSINNNLNNLTQNLDKTAVHLSVVKNEFQSLRNSQFIENRVYEEDETLENLEPNKVQDVKKEEAEEGKIKYVKEAVFKGLEVIDNYFDKVEVNVTDTEDEDAEFVSYILRPKDPYINRPLPYVIGTDEWHKKWHVGLEDSSSESDVDKEPEEQFSDTASESDLPIQDRLHIKGASDTSSELDFSNKTGTKPVANSTFNDSRPPRSDYFGDSSDDNSLPIQNPIPTNNFAEQLAAKLGNVINQSEHAEQEIINKRPLQKPTQSDKLGALFSDEPPPLDDYEDEVLYKNNKASLFPDSGGLFDDDYDESFWGGENKQPEAKQHETTTKPSKNLFDNGEDDEIFNAKTKEENVTPTTKANKSKGLFDTDEDSEDDIFSTVKKNTTNSSYLKPFTKPTSTMPLFDDEPPSLDSENAGDAQKKPIKKPVGGVSILGNTDIFSNQKVKSIIKRQNTSSSENSENDLNENTRNKTENNNEVKTNIPEVKPRKKIFESDYSSDSEKILVKETDKRKKISLFDDDDDLFKDDLFSNITTKKTALNLFDDVDEEPDNEGLFAAPKSKPKSLFDEDDRNLNNSDSSKLEPDSDLIPKSDNSINVDVSKESKESGEDSKNYQKSETVKPNTKLFNNNNSDLFATKAPASTKSKPSLFDDDFEETDDIFSAPFIPKKKAESAPSNKSDPVEKSNTVPVVKVTEPVKEEKKSLPPVSLFDPTPPPDDDNWDTKSEDHENELFSDNDYSNQRFSDNEVNNYGSSLFEEPVSRNESSGFPKDYTRVETDISSFGPLTSSSRRLSSDVFNEEQSNDSLFSAKKRTESVVSANLDIIPEIPKDVRKTDSKDVFEITPSGLSADLYDEASDTNLINDSTKTVSLFESVAEAENGLFSAKNNSNINKDTIESKTEVDGDISKSVKIEGSSSVKSKIEMLSDSFKEEISPTKNLDSPGKLKHNLNINVNALMPGYVPAKSKDMKPEILSSSEKEEEESGKAEINPPSSVGKLKHNLNINVNALIPGSSVSKKSELQKSKSFESDGLNENASDFGSNGVEVLQSVTKDRVRIPVKRRPSTKRGREQIRKSCVDIDISSPPSSIQDFSSEIPVLKQQLNTPVPLESKNLIVVKDPSLGKNEPQSKLGNNSLPIKQEKLTTVSDAKLGNVVSKEEIKVNAVKNEKADIFNDSDDDLFTSSGSVKKEATKVEKSKALFDSDEGEDDLFGSNLKAKPAELPSVKIKSEPVKIKPKQSVKTVDLFGDDDEDDDDLFGSASIPKKLVPKVESLFEEDDDNDDLFGSSRSSKTKLVKKSDSNKPAQAEKKIVKSSAVKKLENKHTNDDPLSALLK